MAACVDAYLSDAILATSLVVLLSVSHLPPALAMKIAMQPLGPLMLQGNELQTLMMPAGCVSACRREPLALNHGNDRSTVSLLTRFCQQIRTQSILHPLPDLYVCDLAHRHQRRSIVRPLGGID